MPKLYFKYGPMGSSKTAQALMCKFNYEQKGFNVILLKPVIDKRDIEKDEIIVKSRIGLKSKCRVFSREDNLFELLKNNNLLKENDVVIIDECQFCTEAQINQLKEATNYIPVLCYGLKTNFKTHLFEGSKRLLEIAESIQEIKCVCRCGKKAILNGKFVNGKLVTEGEEIELGGDEKYEALCYSCYHKLKNE